MIISAKKSTNANLCTNKASREVDLLFLLQPFRFAGTISGRIFSGVIAEIKRKSPSKEFSIARVDRTHVDRLYARPGLRRCRYLRTINFSEAANEDLTIARKFNFCPILRKDFTIDEYQIIETKSIGADAILLIAAALETKTAEKLATFAHSLGLEVLLEVHDEDELKRSESVAADPVGVNNRSLKTFEESIDVSKRLAPLIPKDKVKVSESGLRNLMLSPTSKKSATKDF